jgi:Fe2+ transport system protein FeoA
MTSSLSQEPHHSDSDNDALIRLCDLKTGQMGRIVNLCDECLGSQALFRLQSLGLVEGTEVEVGNTAPLGDPRSYKFRGTNLALRRTEANEVLVRPTKTGK